MTAESTIFLSAPDVGAAERAAMLAAFDSGWIAPVGPQLTAFESELAEYCGATAAVAVTSGTAALQLALLLEGVGPGDEVVVQSATFAASAFAVAHVGATPIFCDSEASTWCLDPALLDEFLAARAGADRLPKAVMPVDLFGSTADWTRLSEVCARYGVALVRDGAEALGSISDTGHVGALDALSVVSFNGNKIITTSSGGALLGGVEHVERARYLATQARQPVIHYEHTEIGQNFRLSNLLAAFGSAQLAQLEQRIERRTEISQTYVEAFPEFDWCPYATTPRPNRWLSVARIPGGDPLQICEALHAEGIQARPAWKPMHRQPVFASNEWIPGAGVADALFADGLCLPSGSSLSDADLHRVIEAVRRIAIEGR